MGDQCFMRTHQGSPFHSPPRVELGLCFASCTWHPKGSQAEMQELLAQQLASRKVQKAPQIQRVDGKPQKWDETACSLVIGAQDSMKHCTRHTRLRRKNPFKLSFSFFELSMVLHFSVGGTPRSVNGFAIPGVQHSLECCARHTRSRRKNPCKLSISFFLNHCKCRAFQLMRRQGSIKRQKSVQTQR